MHSGQKAAIAIVLAAMLLVGLLTGAAYFKKQAADGADRRAQSDAPAQAAAPEQATPPHLNSPYAPAQPVFVPPPQQPVAPPPAKQGGWNAQNLGGTTWAVGTAYGNIIVTLHPGGAATASTPMGPVTGTWSASGNSLTVSAMNQSYTCRIQGWRIIAQDGIPITQL